MDALKQKPLIQDIPVSSEQNLYCKSCGKSTHNLICAKCQDDTTIDKKSFNYCPSCSKRTKPKRMFCTYCYRSFYQPSEKYKDKDLNELYDLSEKYRKNYQFLQIFMLQLVVIALLIANLMVSFNLADEIQFDIYDFIIPALFFGPIYLYNFFKYNQVRKVRIARDPHYRIKLGVVHYEREKATEIIKERFNQYKNQYDKELEQIGVLNDKINVLNRRRPIYRIIFVGSLIGSVVSIFFVLIYSIYIVTSLFLIFMLIGLSFFYIYIRKKHIQYIDEMIRLGKYLAKGEFKMFVFLVIRQLYYLQAIRERDRNR